jgi:hypothetical protein
LPYVYAIESPYEAANRSQISADGRSALTRFKIAGDEETAKERADATLAAVEAAQAAHPQLTIGEFGEASSDNQLSTAIGEDFKTALVTSLPVTLVILLVAFGALVAAGLPLLLGLTSVLATIGLVGLLSHISGVDESINEVILLIGLAVGVDYSMFYLRREREERESGRSRDLGSRGDGLGLHGDDRDGGHVSRGGADVPVVCYRHDPRRRRGRGRVAHRSPRDPCLARRPGGKGADPVSLEEEMECR